MTVSARLREAVGEAVARGDLDALVRLVGDLCDSADWDGVVLLRDRSRAALERGLQLWPAAEYAEYRLALEAPGAYAGAVVVEGAGRFALGPLWEVAADRHTWAELAPHLPAGPARALAAHERVVRGEDLTADPGVDPGVLDLPLALQAWEPQYPVASFHAEKADFPGPERPDLRPLALPRPGSPVDDEQTTEALLGLARPWADQSNGRVEAVVVEGSAAAAIAALRPGRGAGRRGGPVVGPGGDGLGRRQRRGVRAAPGHGRRPGGGLVGGGLPRRIDWPAEPERLGEALAARALAGLGAAGVLPGLGAAPRRGGAGGGPGLRGGGERRPARGGRGRRPGVPETAGTRGVAWRRPERKVRPCGVSGSC